MKHTTNNKNTKQINFLCAIIDEKCGQLNISKAVIHKERKE